MALNPIQFTEKVVTDFLKYQLTTYAFADDRLSAQMRSLLSLEETRQTPLLKGPYISLSRAFRVGGAVSQLVEEKVFHPFLTQISPHPHLYGHQEKAIRAIAARKSVLVSTGTGSGKTECFLYPVISRCLQLRDEKAPAGIVAVLVYPMNALAEDQLGRLRELLAGTGVTFGMYVGKTPEREADVTGEVLKAGSSRGDFVAALERAREEKRGSAVHPPEERCSRERMRQKGEQPRILLTNVKQLELLLTRQDDVEMFDDSHLEFLVCDEAHTYGGASGAETACLIRRLRTFCGRGPGETVCIGTSATLVDAQHGSEAGREFAMRFFGLAADEVELIGEEYRDDDWSDARRLPPAPTGTPSELLREVLIAADAANDSANGLPQAFERLAGEPLGGSGDWSEQLYSRLAANEVCYQLARCLAHPRPIADLRNELAEAIGREITEEEILAWLTLGAASRREGRPLLRPVVHAFVCGVGGAVATFPADHDGPKLSLSAEAEQREEEERGGEKLQRLPITTCRTCGQHYFVHFVRDLVVTGNGLEGGQAEGTDRYWEALDETLGGKRAVLLDRIVGSEDADAGVPRSHDAFLCRNCGSLHARALERCLGCGRDETLVRLLAVEENSDYPGFLTSCLVCSARGHSFGGNYREPARPVRAVAVSDVHVLSQNMIQHAERKRLLVFADNRQDAAFQAGWMRDHARRYRIRALMAERIEMGAVSVGDLVKYLDDLLDRDDSLSRALIPEVWEVHRKEAAGLQHSTERRHYLRILVLREIATGVKQRIGLEPWGRIRVDYLGLSADVPFVRTWAERLGVEPDALAEGIGALLDSQRRGNLAILDREGKIFSRFWLDGDSEIQRGYLPMMRGVPVGLKLERGGSDDSQRLKAWFGTGNHQTLVRQIAHGFSGTPSLGDEFLRALWELLRDELKILAPVKLEGPRGNPLPHCSGAHQIDADRLLIAPHRGLWRCQRCHRAQVRTTPKGVCVAWNCSGTLAWEEEDPDDYDLTVLDQKFELLRPAEHSAQVPADRREELERWFKGDSDAVNALVCTPTLEMGVDIGGLDTVLLRNVPPLPANYWQRVGRAGRRHRLAANITYARGVTHDRAYFANPLKLLEGRVDPPRFNLRNELMLARHVHATVLSRLHQLGRHAGSLPDDERANVRAALAHAFPTYVRDYLFDAADRVRADAFDVSPLHEVVVRNGADLVDEVCRVFELRWPSAEAQLVRREQLQQIVLDTAAELARAVQVVRRRLDWCLQQMRRLDSERAQKGTLDPDEDALYRRCDRLVKRLKAKEWKRRSESQGYDDTYTYGVLATEGFLPGYGLEVGSIRATANVPKHLESRGDFDLPRPPAVALREYVPGNLIYANGRRFVARHFHLETEEPVLFQVDVDRQAVSEIGTASGAQVQSMGAKHLKAMSICDVELAHTSYINDDEEFRFQMPVAVYGYEQNRHGGGVMYRWGDRDLSFRRGVHLRLVNVGPARRVRQELGYPMSLVSGQSRSPFASKTELENFAKNELERNGKPIEHIGFFASIVADCLTLPGCTNLDEAYSLAESLRMAMTRVLDMEREDIEVLAIGQVGQDEVDAVLYDPMPGGSGLLEQACARWSEIVENATALLDGCVALCERSCIDCLQTFRNIFFHRHLDRHLAIGAVREAGGSLVRAHDIPAVMPAVGPRFGEKPVNVVESRLRELLQRASFPQGKWHHEMDLGGGLGRTIPDVFFASDDPDEPGVCVYLDGLSAHIHGNPATKQRDNSIRETLRSRLYEVVAIAATELDDRDAMAAHFFRIAKVIMGKEQARAIKQSPTWFEPVDEPASTNANSNVLPFRAVAGDVADRYRTCVPLLTLRAAAGAFGAGQNVQVDQWVEPMTKLSLREGMFVAQVRGRSMESDIPDGAYCLFGPPRIGSRSGRILLVEHRDIHDPDTDGSYTVKVFDSSGVTGKQPRDDSPSERRGAIRLRPKNSEFAVIELADVSEGEVRVVAEFVEVLKPAEE